MPQMGNKLKKQCFLFKAQIKSTDCPLASKGQTRSLHYKILKELEIGRAVFSFTAIWENFKSLALLEAFS